MKLSKLGPHSLYMSMIMLYYDRRFNFGSSDAMRAKVSK